MSSQTMLDAGRAPPNDSRPSPLLQRPAYLLAAAALALVVFLFDTYSPLEIASAVLYVLVVFIVARTGNRTDILAAAAGCLVLTLVSYVIAHGFGGAQAPMLRAVVSVSAIAIAAILAVRTQAVTETLIQSERRFRQMFNATRIGVIQEDWSLVRARLAKADSREIVGYAPKLIRIVDVNPAFRKIVGMGETDSPAVLGNVGNILADTDRTFAGAFAIFERHGTYYEGETEIFDLEGKRVPVIFGITFPPGADDEVLVFVVDITERRRAQNGLALAQAELAHAARVATLGELTASIAHEVNQPLMAVVTNGEAGLRWLRREPPDLEEVASALQRVIAEGRRAGEIVKRIRGFARKAPAEPVELAVAGLIGESVALIERELDQAAVVLKVELPPALRAIFGDRVQLQQVLVNLMINAIQAMAAAQSERRLTLAARDGDDGMVEIAVIDTGPGIASDDLARLFEPFFTTKPEGMGMGLAISRTTIEAHGGKLLVESTPPDGTTFRLILPGREPRP